MQASRAEKPRRDNRKTKKERKKSILREWVEALAIALVLAVVLTQGVIVNAQVPSASMTPCIHVGDRIIGLRPVYWFNSPTRGDLVIFRWPDDESQLFVKRVIGLPGDRVEIRQGRVYLNDETLPLPEAYLLEAPLLVDQGPWLVPQDAYFVLGDNRNDSLDSRYWQHPFVPKGNIIGQAMLRIYPSVASLK